MKPTIVKGKLRPIPIEYLCNWCGELRLSFVEPTERCANCGSLDIKKGLPGTLSKEGGDA